MKLNNTYLGFTDNKKPMQAARIEKSLDMMWKMENGVFTRKQIVYDYLQNGYKPSIEENYTYYSARLDDYTKPKTLYKLENSEGTYLEINKTLHDFTNYILENGFLDKEKAAQFITDEKKQAELEEQTRLETKRKERLEREQKRKEEEAARIKRMNKRNKELYNLGCEFINRLGHDPIEHLLDKYVPLYVELDEKENNRTVSEEEVKAFYDNWYKKLITLIGNFDYCNYTIKRFADDHKNNSFKEWEFRNISLFLEQQALLAVYSDVSLDDHVNTINAKMKHTYNRSHFLSLE